MSPVPRTVRAASQADSLISDMRALVKATEPVKAPAEGAELERLVTGHVTAVLLLLLICLVFITSAVPDIGPGLAAAVGAHL